MASLNLGVTDKARSKIGKGAGMLTFGDHDMRAWLTLVLTTFCLALWLAGAFSLAHRLAGPNTKEIAPFVLLMVAMLGWIPLFMADWLIFRQYRLMRLGDSTMAHIERRDQPSTRDPVSARLRFIFEANGRSYSGWGRDHVAATSLTVRPAGKKPRPK